MIGPVAYLKKFEGKSNAHLIEFNDGQKYVVKYFQPGFEKSLANEWVAYCLARYLGLPVPFSQIVEIPLEFSEGIPELTYLPEARYQFATEYIPGCQDAHEVPLVEKITNHGQLAGIIVFDYWLTNLDRTRKNVLLKKQAEGAYQLGIIDHAEIFGSYDWVLEDVEKLPATIIKSATHQLLTRFIEDEQQFSDQLELIQKIPIFLIEEIVAIIPDEWQVSREEKKAIVSTLVNRRYKALPKVMAKFSKEVYRGGER